MTVLQLLNLASDKPPPSGQKMETFEEYEALMQARLAAEREWEG